MSTLCSPYFTRITNSALHLLIRSGNDHFLTAQLEGLVLTILFPPPAKAGYGTDSDHTMYSCTCRGGFCYLGNTYNIFCFPLPKLPFFWKMKKKKH